MREKPFFSVIVPVYNMSKYLHRCLDSIIGQTFKDFECLLIDDGSTDDSSFICNEYTEKYDCFRFFQKKNGGVSTARNLGLKHATGSWICFVDSDDYVDKDYLTEFYKLSGKGDLLCQSFIWCTFDSCEKKQTTLDNKYVEKKDFVVTLTDMYRKKLYYYLMNKSFRHDLIKNYKINFDNNLRRRQDELFIDNYVSCISSINMSSQAHYNYYCTPTEKREYYSPIYNELLFNLDTITYYCFYKLCKSNEDYFVLTESIGSLILSYILYSFNQVSVFRQKKQILFIYKYIYPYKNSVSIAKSIRWQLLSPFICYSYTIMKLWFRCYIATMRYKHW